MMLQSEGTYFKVPSVLTLCETSHSHVRKQVFFTVSKGSLSHSSPAKALYFYSNALRSNLCKFLCSVFACINIYTITTSWVSLFSLSDPLPFILFRILATLCTRGVDHYVACAISLWLFPQQNYCSGLLTLCVDFVVCHDMFAIMFVP